MKTPRELVDELWKQWAAGAFDQSAVWFKFQLAIEQRDEEARAERPLQDAGLVAAKAAAFDELLEARVRWGGLAVNDVDFTRAALEVTLPFIAAYRTSKPTPTAVPVCPDVACEAMRRAEQTEEHWSGCEATPTRAVPAPDEQVDDCDNCGAPMDGDAATTSDVCLDCWNSAKGVSTPTAVPVRAEGDAGTLPSTSPGPAQKPEREPSRAHVLAVAKVLTDQVLGVGRWETLSDWAAARYLADATRLLAAFPAAPERCDGCGKAIDPDTCGCGSAKSDGHDGHGFIPAGCDCFRAPSALGQVEGMEQESDPATQIPAEQRAPVEQWACGECGTANPMSRQGCSKCGEHCDDRAHRLTIPARPPTAETCGTCGGSQFVCVACHEGMDECDCGADVEVTGCPACAATEGGKP